MEDKMEEIKTEDNEKSTNTIVKTWDKFPVKLEFLRDRTALIIFIIPIVFGVLTGFLLYYRNTAGTVRLFGKDVEVVQTPTEEGVKDASTFRDTATGVLQETDGKVINEGTHILVREGGVSQNAYLTSSVIDLSKYVGKKVQIWGETFQGQKAGWLMDVGRIKVL